MNERKYEDVNELKIESISREILSVEHRKNDSYEGLLDAIENGTFEVARRLIEDGAPFFLRKSDGTIGMTSLQKAAYHGQLAIGRLLVEKCPDLVTIPDELGLTPLHKAAMQGQLPFVQYLVEECAADIWCVDRDGKTPLQLAQKFGCVDAAKYLTNVLISQPIPEHLTEAELESGSVYELSREFKKANDLLGCRIQTFYKPSGKGMFAKKEWVAGTVVRYDEYKVKHCVKYDTGEEKWEHIDFQKKSKYRLLKLVPRVPHFAVATAVEVPDDGKVDEGKIAYAEPDK